MSLLKDSPEVCQILEIRIMFTTEHRNHGGFFLPSFPGNYPTVFAGNWIVEGKKGRGRM